MATLDDLRRLALALPGAHEIVHTGDFAGDPWFNVGSKTFALAPSDPAAAGRAVLKLDRPHQDLLFEARPEVFQPCKVATVHWAYVDLSRLDETELAALLREAWTQVVPKRVSRALG